MKHLSLKLLFTCVLLFSLFNTNAQSGCTLPAPTDLTPVNVTTTSAEISWTEVVGATDYQVEAIDVDTGISVFLQYTTDNTIVVTGLQPGTTYDIYVTSRCDNTLLGGEASLRLTTGIVIVDVVMNFGCGAGDVIFNGNPGLASSYPISMGQLLEIEGVLPSISGSDFKLTFNLPSNIYPQTMELGTTVDLQGKILFNTSANSSVVEIMREDPGFPGQYLRIADFQPSFGNTPELALNWATETTVVVSRCGLGKGKTADGGPLVVISPNPTSGGFRVAVPEATPLLITDLYGQVWYEAQLYDGEEHEIDASSWPNGSYIVQTIENDQVVNSTLIKTD